MSDFTQFTFGKAALEWTNSSACISNRERGIRFNFSFKNLGVKEGVIVLQFLTYKLSLELFFMMKCKDSHQNGQLYIGSVCPGAAPNLNSSSCHTEARALRVNVVT